jgi:hypothetical protein
VASNPCLLLRIWCVSCDTSSAVKSSDFELNGAQQVNAQNERASEWKRIADSPDLGLISFVRAAVSRSVPAALTLVN